MGECQNDIITILTDRDYMGNLREKVRVIESCKK